MKLLIVLAAAMVVCALAGPAKEKIKEIHSKCKAEVGASDDDLKEIEEQHEVTTDISKKIMACVFTAGKVMQDNKFSKEGALEAARKMLEDKPDMEAKLKVAEEIGEKCSTEIGTPEVSGEEMAKLIFDCLKKETKERGLHPPM